MRAGKITVQYAQRNGRPQQCRKCNGEMPIGVTAWRHTECEPKFLHCASCGPAEGADMPRKNRSTKGELGKFIGSTNEGITTTTESGTSYRLLTMPSEVELVRTRLDDAEFFRFGSKSAFSTGYTRVELGHMNGEEGAWIPYSYRLSSNGRDPKLATAITELTARLESIEQQKPLRIEITRGEQKTVIEGAHKQLPELIDTVSKGFRNTLLVGPSGSGKTTMAKGLAESLEAEFTCISCSAGVSESHFLGRQTLKGGEVKFVSTKFLDLYQNGGVLCVDEVDNSDPNVLNVLNNALDADSFDNHVNGESYRRHENFYVVCGANTWGNGADAVYCGRNQLDGAFLNRFEQAQHFVDYDTDLEVRLASQFLDNYKARMLTEWVWTTRRRIAENKLRQLCTTRLVIGGAKRMAAGESLDSIKARYFRSWSEDAKRKVAA